MYPKTIFVRASKKSLLKELKLKPSGLYFMGKKLRRPFKYKKTFIKKKILNWVHKRLYSAYSLIKSYHYDVFQLKKRPIMVLIVNSKREGLKFGFNFIRVAERTNDRINFRICSREEAQCQLFINRIGRKKLELLTSPSILIIDRAFESNDDHIYIQAFSNNKKILAKEIQKFRNDFFNKSLKPIEFSENIQSPSSSSDEVQKLVFNSYQNFLLDGICN